jgi:putative DNA methylase
MAGHLATILVPKAQELVANPFRHNGHDGARRFFEDGFTSVFRRAREHASPDIPITLYYAFKQTESSAEGPQSAGWETLLSGIVKSGWAITGTWPIRSELGNRTRSLDSNALGSSVVLVLRPRDEHAAVIDRRGFINALQEELPQRLRELQQGAVAPVDLHQAAIGPGMAVFTRYAKVIESGGSAMTVGAAYNLLNTVVDQVQQEGDFDPTTRFAISWYRQHGYDIGLFDAAEKMTRGRNMSVPAMERAGILTSRAGKVSLLSAKHLPHEYNPITDEHISAWEVLHHLIRIVDSNGVAAAGKFLRDVEVAPTAESTQA